MKNRTLEEIIRAEQASRHEGGQFGINACKDSIRFSVEHLGDNLADLLNEYVERANTDAFFNKAMVLACWELMQEEEAKTTAEEGKTMKNYIGRRGEDADRINAVIEAYEATRDGKTADTVAKLVESLGRDGAAVAVATVVNAVSLHDGRISDSVRTWAQSVENAPTNEELHAVNIYGVDSWIHSAHVDNLGTAMMRYLRNTPSEEITEEPKEEIPHLVINAPAWEREKAEAEPEEPTEEEAKQDAPSVCEGCRFFNACGDPERVEPCEGFEIAPSFGGGHDILKAENFGQTRCLMRALNAVFCFDFCKPYHVTRIDGRYTLNKIRKAVEEVAPLYAVNRYSFRVVALCAVDYPTYYAGRLYAVEIEPNGFDIENAKRVNQSRYSSSNSFDYCYKKAQFDELRKAESARCIIIMQASEHLRPAPKTGDWKNTKLIQKDERYDLEKVNTFVYETRGAQYINGVEMRARNASGELIRYDLGTRYTPRRCAIPADEVGAIIDKSGYLTFERREDLKRRAEQARAEKKRRAYEETDNSEKIEQLRAVIGAKRHALAYELGQAKTSEEVAEVYKKLRNYGDGFASIVADFERFEKRTRAKEYPSIEASEKAYNAILTALMA